MLSTLLLIHSREVSKNVTNVTISITYASLFAFFSDLKGFNVLNHAYALVNKFAQSPTFWSRIDLNLSKPKDAADKSLTL
jgi:hypothetical protein